MVMHVKEVMVELEADLRFGKFANAFRVVEEVGGDCYLDFLVYSAIDDEASVVARIRVRQPFLGVLAEHLATAMCWSDPDLQGDFQGTVH